MTPVLYTRLRHEAEHTLGINNTQPLTNPLVTSLGDVEQPGIGPGLPCSAFSQPPTHLGRVSAGEIRFERGMKKQSPECPVTMISRCRAVPYFRAIPEMEQSIMIALLKNGLGLVSWAENRQLRTAFRLKKLDRT